MDLVAGTDLAGLVRDRQGLDPAVACGIVAQVGAALDAAHGSGLVHRDVKPANILLATPDSDPHAYLTDFGLTRTVDSDSALTASGVVVGTPDFMAPEQFEGERVDARADVYALGCVLHFALTGSVPYPRSSVPAKMFAHLSADPPTASTAMPGVPPQLDDVVARALSKAPGDRYPSAGDLGRAALAALEGSRAAEGERSVATGDAAPTAAATTNRLDGPTTATADIAEGPTGDGDVPLSGVHARRRHLRPLVAAIAALGVAGAAGALALSGESGGGAKPPQPALAGAAIPLPATPTGVAANEDGVWIASQKEDAVTRIDPRTRRVTRERIAVGEVPSGIAVENGRVWVANARDNTVMRIDPETNRRAGRPIPVGDTPADIAAGEGAVWTANFGDSTVSRIDPDSGREVKRIRVDGGPIDVAVGDGAVWTANYRANTLTRINPGSNRRVGGQIPVNRRPESVAVGFGSVWIGNIDHDTVTVVDSRTNQVVGTPIAVARRPDDITIADGAVFVVGQDAAAVVRIDPRTREAGKPLTVGEKPVALAAGAGLLWIVNQDAETAQAVRP
jgi:serine/threonine-protein kinase